MPPPDTGLPKAFWDPMCWIASILPPRVPALEMLIEEIKINSQSALAGTTVGGSRIHHQFGIMILAIRRSDGDTRFNPTAVDPIQAGDFLIVMGEPAHLGKLEALAAQTAPVHSLRS